jgi:hypothetical protein
MTTKAYSTRFWDGDIRMPRLDLEMVLPEQFFLATPHFTPERRLLIAVLEAALYDIKNGEGSKVGPARARHARLAWTWIESNEMFPNEKVPVVSFCFVCEHLGLEPGAIRAALRKCQASAMLSVARGRRHCGVAWAA